MRNVNAIITEIDKRLKLISESWYGKDNAVYRELQDLRGWIMKDYNFMGIVTRHCEACGKPTQHRVWMQGAKSSFACIGCDRIDY